MNNINVEQLIEYLKEQMLIHGEDVTVAEIFGTELDIYEIDGNILLTNTNHKQYENN